MVQCTGYAVFIVTRRTGYLARVGTGSWRQECGDSAATMRLLHELIHSFTTSPSSYLPTSMTHANNECCLYPSKPCNEPRAVKVNGELHRLCEFHRQLANRNQQRLQQRRRILRRQQAEQQKLLMRQQNLQSIPMDFDDWDLPEPTLLEPLDGSCELGQEELDILLQLLDSDEEIEMLCA